MKKQPLLGVLVVLVIMVGAFLWRNFRGSLPALLPPSGDIVKSIENRPTTHSSQPSNTNPSSPSQPPRKPAQNSTNFPLKLPDGFSISILAENLNKPRVIVQDQKENLWVSEMGAGSVTRLEMKDGSLVSQKRIFTNLKRPHGLAFDPKDASLFYIAEEDNVSRVTIEPRGTLQNIIDLPGGGRHFSRTIGFGPDERLYVSIGSSCDVCHEKDERRAVILRQAQDDITKGLKLFAKGLRNTVFFTWNPTDGKMWGTDMGRDFLGDELPPDEINVIGDPSTGSGREPGTVPDYGWPICYGKNIHDTAFDKNTYTRNPCMEPFETPSHIDLPAHSAPLGLAFVPSGSQWPKEYWGDLLVSYHGSWNRSEPTGYKIVRFELDKDGNLEAEAKPRTDSALAESGARDFISGWLDGARALGRPVDLLALPDGTLYVTDDKAGVVYKVAYEGT